MSRAPKAESGDWRPSARLRSLRVRALLLRRIRLFFEQRSVLEVETPLLSAATVTDLHLESLSCRIQAPGGERLGYLQTSPEFAMKRLLAAGSGPIYQICKAFRDGELGRVHQPEFTMLEWYRPGFDHHDLMDEFDDLLAAVARAPRAERLTYREAFACHLGIDPHRVSDEQLADVAAEAGIELQGEAPNERDDWLHLLMSHVIEPRLHAEKPTFLYDFPASQAALARVRPGSDASEPAVAERFEVYYRGFEIANGFHELTDAAEQRRRFEHDLACRRRVGLPEPPIDEDLLAALKAGLPPCAGVAVGLDRLLMAMLGREAISDVISFAMKSDIPSPASSNR